MATVKGFKAVRPKEELVEKVASKPYDVLSSEEAREETKGNPYSFLHVVKPEIDLDPSVNVYDESVYQKAAENLSAMIDRGYLVRDREESLYIYRQEWKGHVQEGLVACFSVDEYQTSKIRKHEFTRQKKEDDRVKNILATNANTGPVFLAYRSEEGADAELKREAGDGKLYAFTDEFDVKHTVYRVQDTRAVKEAFEQVPALYIADGHHRAASASRVRDIKKEKNPSHDGTEEYNFFLAVLFPHDQLKILDYNRFVKDLNGLTKEQFLKSAGERFDIEKADETPFKPSKLHEFGMYIGGEWYKLTSKPETFIKDDPVASLDVAILQENLLGPVLGIGDPRTDERIDFIGGIRGLKELEKRVDETENGVAFSMYPTEMEQLLNVADAGKTMPPKSTWFEPKLRSGLFVHLL